MHLFIDGGKVEILGVLIIYQREGIRDEGRGAKKSTDFKEGAKKN